MRARPHEKHGMNGTPEYKAWQHMLMRCTNPNDISYLNYGGRGIGVCDRWKNSFKNFFEDMGYRPTQKHSLDRVDFDKSYSPDNCRWATRKQQAQNTRVRHDNRTGLRGVAIRPGGRYQVRKTINGMRRSLGYFSTPQEAARVYNRTSYEG